jgi:hypothetical protein
VSAFARSLVLTRRAGRIRRRVAEILRAAPATQVPPRRPIGSSAIGGRRRGDPGESGWSVSSSSTCRSGLLLAPRIVTESRLQSARRRFDPLGAVTVTGALLLLVYTISKAPQAGWASARTITLLAVSAGPQRSLIPRPGPAARGLRVDAQSASAPTMTRDVPRLPWPLRQPWHASTLAFVFKRLLFLLCGQGRVEPYEPRRACLVEFGDGSS